MSAIRIDRQVEPRLGITCADLRDALALLDGWREQDATKISATIDRADGEGMCKALLWALSEAVDAMGDPVGAVWLADLHARLERFTTGEEG